MSPFLLFFSFSFFFFFSPFLLTWLFFLLAEFSRLLSVLGLPFGTFLLPPRFSCPSSLSLLARFSLLGFSRSTPQSALWRSSVLMAFGFLQGIFVSPLIAAVSATDPSIPLKAFLLTVLVFGCFSLSALLNTDRAFLYASGVIGAALTGFLALGIMNIVCSVSRHAQRVSVWRPPAVCLFCGLGHPDHHRASAAWRKRQCETVLLICFWMLSTFSFASC